MDITRRNFYKEILNITRDLKKAYFIGFDAEFATLLNVDRHQYRLFDTNEERYDKFKDDVSKMMMTQVGLTAFHYDQEYDTYIATSYTFHLRPQTFADINQAFIFKASSLDFLCRHNFDFNKFMYGGLPFLSKAEEAKVRQYLKDKVMEQKLIKSLDITEDQKLRDYRGHVYQWLSDYKTDILELDVEEHVLQYLVHLDTRLQYSSSVFTTVAPDNNEKMIFYRNKDVEGATNLSMSMVEENLMDGLLGFSRIVYLLESLQKPIIGHNMLLDIVYLHNQFIGPLPSKYSVFKKNIHNMLPNLYDTKYMSHGMYKMVPYAEVWRSNILQKLYEFFAEGQCKSLQNCANYVTLAKAFEEHQTYHEAGWDSFCSGYCFLYLAQWKACLNRGTFQTVGPTELMAAAAPFMNKVNLIRAAIPYMNLSEADPPSHRPDVLALEAVTQRTIDMEYIVSELIYCGFYDIKPYGRRTVLLAPSRKVDAQKIKRCFDGRRNYKIMAFKIHQKLSLKRRMAMWSGALLTGTLVILFMKMFDVV